MDHMGGYMTRFIISMIKAKQKQEWHYHLRSSLHPAFFASIYFVADKFLYICQASSHVKGLILANIPNLAQACIAAIGDLYTWKLSEKIHGQNSASAWSAVSMQGESYCGVMLIVQTVGINSTESLAMVLFHENLL